MTVVEAQTRLREIVAGLEEIEAWLTALLESVQEVSSEIDPARESEAMDVEREVRAVVRCVLDECIRSAIRDLRDATVYPLAWEQVEPGEREAAKVPCLSR